MERKSLSKRRLGFLRRCRKRWSACLGTFGRVRPTQQFAKNTPVADDDLGGRPNLDVDVDVDVAGNYVPDACQGCTLIHGDDRRIVGLFRASPGREPFSWDPESHVFAVKNVSSKFPYYTYLTFSGADVLDRNGVPFPVGQNRSEDGEQQIMTTFVVVVPPRSEVRIGSIPLDAPFADVTTMPLSRLDIPPTLSSALPQEEFCFPLPSSHGPYLCTQGVGGHLTHFFPESYHAIDLRCPCSTPILSIGDGYVKEIEEQRSCGGINIANLTTWNSVTVRLDCGLLVDYLHILPGSAKVRVGERVRTGQTLCESGDIGFAPEPHVHIELHHVADPDGPSCPLSFRSDGASFVPSAGRWYCPSGEVELRQVDMPLEALFPSSGCCRGRRKTKRRSLLAQHVDEA